MSRKSSKATSFGFEWTKTNYILLGAGLFLIIVGFLFLGFGDITIAPVLLVLGYCVIIPLGILYPKKNGEQRNLAAERDESAG
jgi:hypothetical protein